jgi:hypothetical protein
MMLENVLSPKADFRVQRRAGMIAIAGGMVVAVVVWLAIYRDLQPLSGMDAVGARMIFTLKTFALVVLFSLVLGVEAVAHERLSSPAFDPLAGFETRRLRINQRYLQNTLEQTVVFAVALFGLAATSPNGSTMRAIPATAVVWVICRWAFWIGYHKSAAMRGLGAPGMALSMIVLLYVAAQFGAELAGPAGAAAPIVLFLTAEAILFWTTRPSKSRDA